jgi:hypothetical protein
MAGTRQFRTLGQVTPQISQFTPRVINRFGELGIGRDEQFLLQTAIGGVAAFGGSFFGAKAGVQSSTPALQSLLADTARAAGLPSTADALAPKPTAPVKRPLSTTAKTAIAVGGAGALALLFLV